MPSSTLPSVSTSGLPMAQLDPLIALKGIQQPDAIATWPPTIGWWIVLLILIITLIATLFFAYRHWKQNHYREIARQHLEDAFLLFNDNGDKQQYLVECNQLLKRAALSRFPADQVAGLTGESWLFFLDQTLQSWEFSSGVGKAIASAPYQVNSDVSIPPIHQLGLHWIKNHKVIKHTIPQFSQGAYKRNA